MSYPQKEIPQEEIPEEEIAMRFQYAVKFVCGESDGTVVAPGEYWTAINVHNPTFEPISFQKTFAIALPGEQAGSVSELFDATLDKDEALEIDRDNIFEHAGTDDPFLKGFVFIQSPIDLDVVAVYTAADIGGEVKTLTIERVSPRVVE